MSEKHERDMNILFLEVCKNIQLLSAEVYHRFGDAYGEIPSAALLWKKAALEEENHSRQFELLLRLKNEVAFELIPTDPQRAWHVQRIIIKLLDILKHITPELMSALTLTIEMEELLANLHVQKAVRFMDESVERLFKACGRADQEYVGAFERFRVTQLLSMSEIKDNDHETARNKDKIFHGYLSDVLLN
ncbi:MAG: hypothetical protein HXX11_18410 [Desulfuromonadales bacterium]|nr:hypothetical protein [Desulfuromonadales bacterium]